MLTPVNFANKKVIPLSTLPEDISHFLLRHGFWITGMYQDPLQVVCWQYGGMSLYTTNTFSKILVLFFFVNILVTN